MLTHCRSYVDVIPPTPIPNLDPAYGRPLHWPTFQAEAGLQPGNLRQPCGPEQSGATAQHPIDSSLYRPSGAIIHSQKLPFLAATNLPPVEPSKQLASTPELSQGAHSPTSSQNTPATQQTVFTPPSPAGPPRRPSSTLSANSRMADPRRSSGQQRPLMPPPETPSRVMQASPNMFPTLQFSPDLFSNHHMGPMTAPIYPQQRLFWDQTNPPPEQLPIEQFSNPYQEAFDASFHSSSTIVPSYSPVVSQEPVYDLPQQSPVGPFLDNTVFPMPFQTSPRPPPPPVENPTQFLSSPARRFGPTNIQPNSFSKRPPREMPAYHHQIEESKRERELEQRRRNKTASKQADADLIMSSVKRALSPSTSLRPSLQRSLTHSGVTAHHPSLRRRRSKVSFTDSASVSSVASAESNRNGRSSPLKSLRPKRSFSSLSKSRVPSKSRTALSLAIDENGVAKTVLEQLPEFDNDMDVDEDSQSVVSSADEGDFNAIRSQNTSFAFDEDDSASAFSHISAGSSGRRRESGRNTLAGRSLQNAQSTIMPLSQARSQNRASIRVDTRNTSTSGRGDAQKALRAIIEDRSRSISTQGENSSSRQSDSSVQFHSSPPIQQNQYGDFNASPTTITDPDLATPSTDQDSYGSLGATRCICNLMSADGSAMIQWYVRRKV